MDIIEFAEKVCGCNLVAWQKELLKRIDSLPKDYKLVYCLGRRRWALTKESELSQTSIVPFSHNGYQSRICLIDETAVDTTIE